MSVANAGVKPGNVSSHIQSWAMASANIIIRRDSVQCSHRSPAPTSEELQYFGLEAGDRARTRDTKCVICKETVQHPVITSCQHVYCFECIYQWFGRSTHCPQCYSELSRRAFPHPQQRKQQGLKRPLSPTIRHPSPGWSRSPRASLSSILRSALRSSEASSEGPGDSFRSSVESSPRTDASSEHWEISFQYRLAPLKVQKYQGHRRQTPSYGSAAYIDEDFAPPQPIDVAPPLEAEDKAITGMILHNDGRLPRTSREQDEAARRAGVVLIDHGPMLDRMWQANEALSATVQVPLRCRAIAKCVWREWREFLKQQQGRWLLADDLLQALSSSFERTVVEYNWASHYRDLPLEFVDLIREIARAGITTGCIR